MELLRPFSIIPELNTATILLVENEDLFQSRLADAMVQQERDLTVNVRLACRLPLPAEQRPRVDMVAFVVQLRCERSLRALQEALAHLSHDYFLGRVCFLVTDARCGALTQERFLAVRRLAASHRATLICVEHKTEDGVSTAASRLLALLKVSSGASPTTTTALYLSTLTRCTPPPDLDED